MQSKEFIVKKFSRVIFGLLATAMLFAGTASLVSCANEDSKTPAPETKKETTKTTKTVTINGTTYTYTTVDGQAQSGTNVTVNTDGTVTVTASDGSSVTFSGDGNSITYKDTNDKTYTGSTSTTGSESENVTLTNTTDSNDTVSATSSSETKTETKPSSSTNTDGTVNVTEFQYTDASLNGKIFRYTSDSGTKYFKFADNKVYRSSDNTNWRDYTSDWVEDNMVVIKWGDNFGIYQIKLPRTSGTGLYATFSAKVEGDDRSLTFNSNMTGTMTPPTTEFSFTNNNGVITVNENGKSHIGLYTGSEIYLVGETLTLVSSGSSTQTPTSSISLVGKTFIGYRAKTTYTSFESNDAKVAIRKITFGTTTASVGIIESEVKNHELPTDSEYVTQQGFLYSVSGSTITVSMDKTLSFTLAADEKSFTDESGTIYRLVDNDYDVYAFCVAHIESEKAKANINIVILNKDDGKGTLISVRLYNGVGENNDLVEQTADITYTISGTELTINQVGGSGTMTGIFSADKSQLTIKNNVYFKLN